MNSVLLQISVMLRLFYGTEKTCPHVCMLAQHVNYLKLSGIVDYVVQV